MDNRVKKYLSDVLKAIREIDSFFETRPRQFAIYKEELVLRRAIERNISIIGEAINKAFQLDSTLPITHIRNIVGTRNRIIHSYDSLVPELIWGIVINDLPILKKEIEDLLII